MCYTHKKFKKSLNHELLFKKVRKMIRFNQKAWLKPYIDMDTKLRQKSKNKFEKYFFQVDE